MVDPSTLTVREVCARLRCGTTTVYELFRSGRLRSVKVGRLRRVLPEDLAAYLQQQASQPKRTA